MLDAEAVASEGHFDEALSMMDAIVGASDPSDTMSKIIKANILMQKVHITSCIIVSLFVSIPVITSQHFSSLLDITSTHCSLTVSLHFTLTNLYGVGILCGPVRHTRSCHADTETARGTYSTAIGLLI